MPVRFTLGEQGYLDWRSRGEGAPDLTIEEAQVIALAEIAEAFRFIGGQMGVVAQAIDEHGDKQ